MWQTRSTMSSSFSRETAEDLSLAGSKSRGTRERQTNDLTIWVPPQKKKNSSNERRVYLLFVFFQGRSGRSHQSRLWDMRRRWEDFQLRQCPSSSNDNKYYRQKTKLLRTGTCLSRWHGQITSNGLFLRQRLAKPIFSLKMISFFAFRKETAWFRPQLCMKVACHLLLK